MSCLFNSLAYFIPLPSQTIRETICDYLAANKPLLEDLDTGVVLGLDGTPEAYLLNMRNPATWGGAIEIQAACNLWNLSITVWNVRDPEPTRIRFEPIQRAFPEGRKEIAVEWSGGHYEPLKAAPPAIEHT